MKKAIIGTRGLPARYGGFETLAERLGYGLAERGHSVTVYGRWGQQQERVSEPVPGLVARRLPALPFRGTETISSGLVAAIFAVCGHRPDVALVCNPANFWAAMVLEKFGIPLIVHLDGLEHEREKWRGLGARVHARAMFRAARSGLPLLTDSEAIRRWYEQHFDVSPVVITYGADRSLVDDQVLGTFGLKRGAFDLIVARWEPENQLIEMVRAHARARAGTLVVVGEPNHGRYREAVLEEIARHGNARSVGRIFDWTLLGSLYAGARIYLHGHSVGGTNPTLLNGAAAGVEVLVHDNPFNREVVGSDGWAWQDEDALCELLVLQPWVEKPRSEALAQSILRRYRWADVVDRYEEVLRSIASRR